MTLEHLIKEKHGTIVDVRTHEEFMGGHVATSINIPLNEIQERLEEMKALPSPLILCCASGGRSGQAEHFLLQHGIDCTNGGSWLNVNFYQSLQNKID
ncbi:rhodanese-like domain-containing protein [Flavobacterium succinicans]|uniref:Thiosulfate sulfurtransferase GlpE n=1 Tax=Flavobacterium succinicans TaxID=29536 RepID=A0A199XSC9_9FLAO|nr:rhodanese-like domain-containing protein [Flavobacterium succinicans]OAZ04658.1 thiosulfate sulfurtransferase GlpE [Flavobacterium succinicans]